MKTFREIAITENLTYTVSNDDFDNILKASDYKRMSKGGKHEKIKLFGNSKEVLFNYDEKNKKMVVLKQGWQLMNIKRGY